MPHPSQMGANDIVRAARELLEERGPDGVVMREVARRLGVSAPSLYFHVSSRQELLDRLIDLALGELGAALPGGEGVARFPHPAHVMADAYLDFALRNQQLFSLVFGPCAEERRFAEAGSDPASRALLEMVGRFVPPAQVVAVAQVFWALVHGFAALMLAGQFRMHGDPRIAMHNGIDLLLGGLERGDHA